MACGADVRLGGELSETRSPLREVGLDVRSVLHPGLHDHLPEGALEMTSKAMYTGSFAVFPRRMERKVPSRNTA